MTGLDHLFVIAFAILHPVAGLITFRRLLARIEAGEQIDRANLYTKTMLGQWLLFVIGAAIWIYAGRSWPELGLGLELDAYFAAGAALTVAGIVLLARQNREVAVAGTEELKKLSGRIGELGVILPRNGNELTRFYGLALTAGIVEETLWRGFLIWYLDQFLPLWAAALVSIIAFGFAHAYQGKRHLPAVTLVGGAFTGLYLLTGSIWLPMILHAAVDALQGRMAYGILHRMEIEGTGTADASRC